MKKRLEKTQNFQHHDKQEMDMKTKMTKNLYKKDGIFTKEILIKHRQRIKQTRKQVFSRIDKNKHRIPAFLECCFEMGMKYKSEHRQIQDGCDEGGADDGVQLIWGRGVRTKEMPMMANV